VIYFGLILASYFYRTIFSTLKRFRKIILYFLLTLVILFTGVTISVFLFKDRIIQQFVNAANQKLNTPVKIGKIDISMFSDFPNIAIVFSAVYVEDSHPGNYPLLTADRIAFNLNAMELWKGNYSIRGLAITGSETNLKNKWSGKGNFIILKDTPKEGGGAVSFDLRNVTLNKTILSYQDQQLRHHHVFNSEKLIASILVIGDLYQIEAEGDVVTEQIGINNSIYLNNKSFLITAQVDYNDAEKSVLIKPSIVKVGRSDFSVNGNYSFKEKNLIDLKAEGKDTDIQTLLSLLPDAANQKLKQYRSEGDVFFNLGS
jgi:hypothetical protein